MFTGIIQAVGHIHSVEPKGEDLRLGIADVQLTSSDLELGESIATNGVCLTATGSLEGQSGFYADLSVETLRATTAGSWKVGTKVNLERSLTPQMRLGGHLVSGHVDGVGEVLAMEQQARALWFKMRAPEALKKYIAYKGSICIDGTSLTVNAAQDDCFELTIIPHTLEATVIAGYKVGTQVNLEVDQIARYLERLIQHRSD